MSVDPVKDYVDSLNSVPYQTYDLWFCGLGTSLASAVLAMLMQSWVRRYAVMTHPEQSPRGRALIRAYVILDGSLKSLQLIMDSLHFLLDISIFSFLAGLLVLIVATAQEVGSFILVIYISIPLFLSYLKLSVTSFLHPTIFTTPFSRVTGHGKQFLRLIFSRYRFPLKSLQPHKSNGFLGFDWVTLGRVDQVAEKLIETQNSRLLLDGEIVAWLLSSLRDDQDLERFLECIPGFYDSDQVKQPEQVFRPFHMDRMPRSILSFMRRTLSSATLPEDIKQKRIRLSLEVIELDPYLLERTFFHALTLPPKPTIFQCVDFILLADRFTGKTDGNHDAQLLAKCVIAVAISCFTTQKPGERWSPIIEHWLVPPISDTSPGQLLSMKLLNLVRLVEALDSASPEYQDMVPFQTVFAAGNFLMDYAASQHQNKFCILWNRLLDSVGSDGSNASLILPNIRSVYNTLHGGTLDSPVDPILTPTDYPRCIAPTHHFNTHLTPGINPIVTPASGQVATSTAPQPLSPLTRRSTSP